MEFSVKRIYSVYKQIYNDHVARSIMWQIGIVLPYFAMYESLSDELSLIYTVGYRIEMEYVCILKRHVNEGIKVAERKK